MDGLPRLSLPKRSRRFGKYVSSTSRNKTTPKPMRKAASRSARTGSVHQRHRLKGQGSQGGKPTTVPSILLGGMAFAHAFKTVDHGVEHFHGQHSDLRLSAGLP